MEQFFAFEDKLFVMRQELQIEGKFIRILCNFILVWGNILHFRVSLNVIDNFSRSSIFSKLLTIRHSASHGHNHRAERILMMYRLLMGVGAACPGKR